MTPLDPMNPLPGQPGQPGQGHDYDYRRGQSDGGVAAIAVPVLVIVGIALVAVFLSL